MRSVAKRIVRRYDSKLKRVQDEIIAVRPARVSDLQN